MEVWISRDSKKAGGYVLAWVKEPTWHENYWYHEGSYYSPSLRKWSPRDFESHFGFLPDCGTCQKMLMQLEPFEDQP